MFHVIMHVLEQFLNCSSSPNPRFFESSTAMSLNSSNSSGLILKFVNDPRRSSIIMLSILDKCSAKVALAIFNSSAISDILIRLLMSYQPLSYANFASFNCLAFRGPVSKEDDKSRLRAEMRSGFAISLAIAATSLSRMFPPWMM